MIFPWRPADDVGLTIVLHRAAAGFGAKPMMPAWFIPCIGASSSEGCSKVPNAHEAKSVRSAWFVAEREPDESAIAVYDDLWFSSQSIANLDI